MSGRLFADAIELQRDAAHLTINALEWQRTVQAQGMSVAHAMVQSYAQGLEAMRSPMREALEEGAEAAVSGTEARTAYANEPSLPPDQQTGQWVRRESSMGGRRPRQRSEHDRPTRASEQSSTAADRSDSPAERPSVRATPEVEGRPHETDAGDRSLDVDKRSDDGSDEGGIDTGDDTEGLSADADEETSE
ncbi:hypothetical protein [Natronobiforma cellulositropha]|uniref:hypothetical protein n=1 Tax=Natronobiforma cellulositropha TaxID=1679076 RepID=UPI0021D57E8F|nr:hypothetical protein [Natronobiforma cellulositropha]